MDRTTGHDSLPGSGGHHEAGEDGGEGIECPVPQEEEKESKELTVDSYIDSMDLSGLSPRQRARFELETEEQQRLTDEAKDALSSVSFGERVKRDEIMAHHTSFRVGGIAEAFVAAQDIQDVREVISFAAEKNVPVTFLGNGTSTLVRDGAVRGIVLKLGEMFGGIDVQREEGDAVFVSVGAGVTVGEFVRWIAVQKLTGFDVQADARETVAGRFMIEPSVCASCIDELTIVDKAGREMTLTRKAITDGERIRFGRSAAITRMVFKLTKRSDEAVSGEHDETPINERARLAGVFKKIGKQSAASIIADAGLSGIRVGRVRIDDQDANCLINEGNAKARDALVLIGLIKERVKQSQGIQLETAVRIVGEE